MNTDDTLRKLFEELKRQDGLEAPFFHDCLPRGVNTTQPRFTARILFLSVSTAVVVVVAGVLFFDSLHQSPALPEYTFEEWASLSNWQSPSDQLVAQNSNPQANRLSAPSDNIFDNAPSTATAAE